MDIGKLGIARKHQKSFELAASIAKIKKTVQRVLEDIKGKLELQNGIGNPIFTQIYFTNVKLYYIIVIRGKNFKRDDPNEEA